jgi:hypothetical protein
MANDPSVMGTVLWFNVETSGLETECATSRELGCGRTGPISLRSDPQYA